MWCERESDRLTGPECQHRHSNEIESGACCGMVAQADIALHAPAHEIAEVVRDVSRPTHETRQ